MSDSQQPHGLQPTRLLRPWDFPGKSTGVGCHCLLHILAMYIQICSHVNIHELCMVVLDVQYIVWVIHIIVCMNAQPCEVALCVT